MQILRKIIDFESFEISQENFYDGVSFSKVANLPGSDCNCAIKRTQHRFFLDYVPKTSCLKKIKREKVQNSQFYQKSRTHVRPS